MSTTGSDIKVEVLWWVQIFQSEVMKFVHGNVFFALKCQCIWGVFTLIITSSMELKKLLLYKAIHFPLYKNNVFYWQ